jgi:hypothetical protein
MQIQLFSLSCLKRLHMDYFEEVIIAIVLKALQLAFIIDSLSQVKEALVSGP